MLSQAYSCSASLLLVPCDNVPEIRNISQNEDPGVDIFCMSQVLRKRSSSFPHDFEIMYRTSSLCEPGSSVSIVSGYGLDDRAIEVRSPAEAKGFVL
jgi:hypothetical protein